MSSEQRSLINDSGNVEGRQYQSMYEEYVRPVLAEFFGTTLFVCVGCLCVLQSGNGQSPATVPFSGIGIAAGHGLTIALLVSAMGDVRSVSGRRFTRCFTGANVAQVLLCRRVFLFANKDEH